MSASFFASGDIVWRTSRTCDGGACVGVARLGESVFIRNTNNRDGYVSEFTADEWRQFLAGVKLGDFDEIACSPASG